MRIFLQYCSERKSFLIFCLWCALIGALLFFLYGLQFEAYWYGMALCGCGAVFWIGNDFSKYYRTHALWKRCADIHVLDLDLEQTTDDPDLQSIFVQIALEKNHLISAFEHKSMEQSDYFATWVHQVKLPVSAMRLMLANHDMNEKDWKQQIFSLERYLSMVLAYLRMTSESSDYIFREFALDPVVRKAIRMFSTQFIYKKIRLDFQETHLKVLSDEKWLQFVIEQILSNAVKYSPAGSMIRICSIGSDLIIEDEGCGISKSDLKRITEKGYTGENGRLNSSESSGLGLYLVYSIMRKLNHPITIESEPQKGTKVILHLQDDSFVRNEQEM